MASNIAYELFAAELPCLLELGEHRLLVKLMVQLAENRRAEQSIIVLRFRRFVDFREFLSTGIIVGSSGGMKAGLKRCHQFGLGER